MRPTICLNMIVKDEAHVIRRCLESVRPLIDTWVIVDTGSSDGTQALIREIYADLPGELHDRPWRGFGASRTEAIELAAGHGDYLLFIDADDVLELPQNYQLPRLELDAYKLLVRHGTILHWRPHLVSTKLTWRYVGVLHEYLECGSTHSTGTLKGPSIAIVGGGGRSQIDEKTKYTRDAQSLEIALKEDPDNARYMFYLAQSWRDAGDAVKALAAYDKRASMGGWIEEVYRSLLTGARIALALKHSEAEVVARYLSAYQAVPTRAEALGELARYYRLNGSRWHLAHLFAEQACSIPMPSEGLFLEPDWYAWVCRDEYAIACYWTGRYADSAESCKALLRGELPEGQRARILENLRYSEEKLMSLDATTGSFDVAHTTPSMASAAPAQMSRNNAEMALSDYRKEPVLQSLQERFSSCPLCAHAEMVDLGSHDCTFHALWHDALPRKLDWRRCPSCGHVFTASYWTPAGLAAVFTKCHDYQLAGGDPDAGRYRWAPIVNSIVTRLGGYQSIVSEVHRLRWLDVGCGDGALVMTAQEFGFASVGLDARAETVSALRAIGVDAIQGSLSQLTSGDRFDVISLCDVLEHVPFPRQALASVRSALNPGGLCFISCPNSDSSSWRQMDLRQCNPYWGEIEHHHNFSAKTLVDLLNSEGFAAVDYGISNRYKACMQITAQKILAD